MREPTRTGRRLIRRATLIGLLGAACFAAIPAYAEDLAPDEKALDTIMTSLGLIREAGPGIDYRQRSPLVIPPDNNLPVPQRAATNNPNWPVDPETRQMNAIKAMQRKDDGLTSSQRLDKDMLPLPRSEIEKGRAYGKGRPDGSTVDDKGLPLSLDKLGYNGGLWDQIFGKDKKSESATFTGEPARTSLIEPPVGYQTPSPNQAYGLGKEKPWQPKAYDPYLDHGVADMNHF